PCFSLQPSAHHRDLHSFPTRRSSDLRSAALPGTRSDTRPRRGGGGRAARRDAVVHRQLAAHDGGIDDPQRPDRLAGTGRLVRRGDRKSTRLNSSHLVSSYAVFCLKKKTYGEAAQLLAENGAGALDRSRGTPTLRVMLVAGGTDLFPNMKRRQFTPELLISLARVRDASGIQRNGHLDISAGTTLSAIAHDPGIRERSTALAEAAELVSTPQLRNMGTIGGNICLDTRCNWYDQSLFWRTAEGFCMKTNPDVVCRVATSSPRCLAVASADTVPALLALGASVHFEDARGAREVPMSELYREDGIRPMAMRQDEVLTGITLPETDG